MARGRKASDKNTDYSCETAKNSPDEEIIALFKGNRKELTEDDIDKIVLHYASFVDWLIRKNFGTDISKEKMEELHNAGLVGIWRAIPNYDPDKGAFTTYSKDFIEHEIFEVWGLKAPDDNKKPAPVELPPIDEILMDGDIKEGPRIAKEEPERRALQLLEVLRIWTDEDHKLSQRQLDELLALYRYEKHGIIYKEKKGKKRADYKTTKALMSLLLELDPYEYCEENKDEYKLLYDGYEENRLKSRLEGKEKQDITGFWYSHIFSNDETDKLIETVCFSDMLTKEEKTRLVGKIVNTTSNYYQTPFWDGKQIRFNPRTLQGRLSRKLGMSSVAENNRFIQKAIQDSNLIQFKFNRYTKDSTLEPLKDKTGEDRIFFLRPYHLVVYHDTYYCIGFHEDSDKIWHYRVDLMTDIEVAKDEKGEPRKIEYIPSEALMLVNTFWNPEKYMSEHLYMDYGEPREIMLKIPKDDFTFIHDWFGDHFTLCSSRKKCDPDHILIIVNTTPDMLVHWAMQYSGKVEVMDREVRKMIRKELDAMREKYEE